MNALDVIRFALADARLDWVRGYASASMLNYYYGECVGAFCCSLEKDAEIAMQAATNEIRFLIRKVRGI